MKMVPGFNSALLDQEIDEKKFVRIEAMISSMTNEERENPNLLNGSRRLRIANGSGTTVQELNQFMKSFEMTQKMMKEMTSGKGMRKMLKKLNMKDSDINSFAKSMEDIDNDNN
jgi:signal recognition particle subunit SRP54